MERIIENGLNSIRVGLDDYELALAANDDARLTSAVRNVYAGILLLAKGKLYELSPADTQGILIRVVRPQLVSGRLELVPEGRKTIGFDEIKKRFRHFALPFDWAQIERIHAIRNDLEHFYHDGARSSVQEALADAATAIRALLKLLKLDPLRDLGERWWAALLRNESLFAEELAACNETFARVRWINPTAAAAKPYFSCRKCGSPLVRQIDPTNVLQDDIQATCVACGAECEMKTLVAHGVTKQHFRELYETKTRGGEPPVVRCPACHIYALVLDSNQCAACGNSLDAATTWCEICQNPISASELRDNAHQCLQFFQH